MKADEDDLFPFLPSEHRVLCESYAKQYFASHRWRERKAEVPLPVAVHTFAHYVGPTNLASYFDSQGRGMKMKGQSEIIHNPGLKVQGKMPGADRSDASDISSPLFVMSYSYLYILTHFLSPLPFP